MFVLARNERANRVRGVTSGVSTAETNTPMEDCCTMRLPSRMTGTKSFGIKFVARSEWDIAEFDQTFEPKVMSC